MMNQIESNWITDMKCVCVVVLYLVLRVEGHRIIIIIVIS